MGYSCQIKVKKGALRRQGARHGWGVSSWAGGVSRSAHVIRRAAGSSRFPDRRYLGDVPKTSLRQRLAFTLSCPLCASPPPVVPADDTWTPLRLRHAINAAYR